MQAILQSAFLQALSYSLIVSIWQMAVIWLVTITLLRLFKFSSAQKFNLAFIAQLTGFVLFIYTCARTYNTGAEKIIIGKTSGDFISTISNAFTLLMPYLAIIYLGMLLFKLTRLIFIYHDTQELKKQGLKKISADSRIFVQQVSEMLSLRRKVKIYLSEKIICPLTTGFLKPVILIPVAAVNHLTKEQMEAVILHELAHIKRADYLLYILQSLVEKIFFFNIFSAMLNEIIEHERENACDDWVLQFRYNSMLYAEALFKLGRLKTLPAFVMPLPGKKESLLMIRIKRLLHNSQTRNRYSLQPVLLGFLSVMIAAGLLMSSSPAESIKQEAGLKTPAWNIIAGSENKKNQGPENKILFKTVAVNQVKKKESKQTELAYSLPLKTKQIIPEIIETSVINKREVAALKQDYLVKVRQSLDSIRQTLPRYEQAVNSQALLTADMAQKAISYQNFKQIEAMLAASGDSINVTETEISKDSYRKQITIESTDKNGNKHVYNVIVELYQ